MKEKPYAILVVDDEEMIRVNLEAFLLDEGFVVFTASSGEDAVELLKHHPVDVAIVDMRLPNMDGNRVILNALALHPSIKCLIHTGSSEYNLPQELLDVGFTKDQILLKPLSTMNIVIERINALMAS
jgi:CheY-like chemotaxis protein